MYVLVLELQDLQSSSQIINTNKPTSSFLQDRRPSCQQTNSVSMSITWLIHLGCILYTITSTACTSSRPLFN